MAGGDGSQAWHRTLLADRPERAAGFDAPSPIAGYIERTRLDPVYRSGRGRLIRVLAPAGYGKTSLVARWMKCDARPVRWIDVDRHDDDPVALLDDIRDALSGLVDVSWPSASDVQSELPCATTLRRAFVESVAARSVEPFVVVLDDIHHLRSRGSAELLAVLAESLPAEATMLLIGRAHHDCGSIGRLRLTPGVTEVTVDDLKFDGVECHQLLRAAGSNGWTPDLAKVVELLDGWPAGLQLAARVATRDDTAPMGADIADHVALIDYLRGEWTGQLDPGDLDVLREVACLTRFSGELCERVLGRRGAAECIHRLHRDQLVVFPLDKREQWYRLHPLLSRWLAGELRTLDPSRWTTIHLSAATYWESVGEVDLAVRHAQLAADVERCAELVTRYGGAYFTRGRDATVQAWLDHFSADHLRRSPALCSLSVINALHAGDEARALQWLRLADAAVEQQTDTDGLDDASAWWVDILHAALEQRPAATLIPVCERAVHHLAGGPWAGFASWVLAALHFLDGDPASTDAALEAAMFEAKLAGTPLVNAHCLATSAIVADCRGDQGLAQELARQAMDVLRSCHGERLPPTAPAMAVGALMHARDGRRDDALLRIGAARRALESFRFTVPWLNVLTRIALLRATLLLDEREVSQVLMRELEDHAGFETSEQGARTIVEQLRRQVDAMHRPATGATALTDAELAVLRKLPSNLSLAMIAEGLFVSRNTVKSHVASIYRKLGVDNRADAVDRAHAAGLLGDPLLSG